MEWKQIGLDTYSHLKYFFTDTASTVWGIIVGIFLFMIGEVTLSLYAIFTLFILDILTRVFANAKKHGGYINATRTGKIRSRLAVQGMVSKLFTYFIVLSVSRMITYVVPISLISDTLTSVIFSTLVIVEVQSILENLLDANNEDANTKKLINLLLLRFKKEQDRIIETVIEEQKETQTVSVVTTNVSTNTSTSTLTPVPVETPTNDEPTI